MKHRDVEVRISRRTLWVDMQAYPLPMVTRVQPLEVTVRRGRVVSAYLREVAAWLVLGVVGLAVIGCLGAKVAAPLGGGFALIVLIVLAGITVRFVRRLTEAKLYVLSISNAGGQHAAVASRDRDQIWGLARRVVDAIDDPAMEYSIHVDHIEVKGDVFGGDKVGRDKVMFSD